MWGGGWNQGGGRVRLGVRGWGEVKDEGMGGVWNRVSDEEVG